jgi:hypothetical protein
VAARPAAAGGSAHENAWNKAMRIRGKVAALVCIGSVAMPFIARANDSAVFRGAGTFTCGTFASEYLKNPDAYLIAHGKPPTTFNALRTTPDPFGPRVVQECRLCQCRHSLKRTLLAKLSDLHRRPINLHHVVVKNGLLAAIIPFDRDASPILFSDGALISFLCVLQQTRSPTVRVLDCSPAIGLALSYWL